jgi:histidinol dehydrogenase
MVLRLDASAPDFDQAFARFVALKRDAAEDVRGAVTDIIAAVRAEGDAALLRFTERFDRVKLDAARLRVGGDEIEAAVKTVAPKERAALDFAAKRIEAFHRRQMPQDMRFTDETGTELGWRWLPVAAAGVYVPGGTAAYPSSVLMNVIPARVAGVNRIAMTVPAPDGKLNPLVIVAAARAGVTEIYRVGGAQAVAALAYGTAAVKPVDVIVGPGNVYVAEAKRQVFGRVGIDLVAGPSEILVIADKNNDPIWIAADLLSQAEHAEDAQAVLITDDADLADRVVQAVNDALATLAREKIARASWERFGAVILVKRLADAVPLAERIAPEHVEVLARNAEAFGQSIRNAGAIFLGAHTPEAIGDYVAGTNHVLPTSGAARFASGLSVFNFLKRTSLVRCDARAFGTLAPHATTLAEAEGLSAHARSLKIRMDKAPR